ncbi:MAG TPA: twin-arginine translocase subunit TatC [Thermomicrobiales bacterium]|nr:twin-arginine translocase subunit TatC [Thermomicrobiales bacterium]
MAGTLHLPKFHMPSMPGFSGDDDYVDVFEEMTLAEHLDELRSRLVKTCIGIGLAFIVGLFLTRPLLGVVRDNANVERFDVINATEPITDFFKTAAYIAIAIALPLIFYEIFAFVSPGMTRREKRYLYGSLPFVVIFFLLGVSFAFFLAIPRAFEFLSNFNSDLFDYSPTYGSIASFYLQVSLGMGIAFELPIIMFLLARLGIVSPKRMSSSRRYAIVVVMVAAAIITPTPDPFNMLFVAAPIYLLYEVGIVFAKIAARRKTQKSQHFDDDETPALAS